MVNWNLRKYSREEFLDAYHKTSSINEMLNYLDMRVSGASYTSVRLALIDEGLLDGEVSHRVNTNRLRKMLIDDGHDSCALCGIQDWMGKPLTLHVDHIDGDNSNNSMDNLRFLCPSCHSQTKTFGAKNGAKIKHCDCKCESVGSLCTNCSTKKNIDRDDLHSKDDERNFVESVLIEGSKLENHKIKNSILKYELIEDKCSCCGISGDYNDSPLTLHLEHINGVRNDHRLENLTFLCPNCHSQTDTYCGRNISPSTEKCPKCNDRFARKSYKGMCHTCYREHLVTCPDCGGVKESTQKWCSDCRSIHIKNYKPKRRSHGHREYRHKKYPCVECGEPIRGHKRQRCWDCHKKHMRRNIPSKDSLCEKLVLNEGNVSAIAREFNVSFTSVKKWLKGYGLPYLKGDIQEFISSYGQSSEQKV